MEYMMLLGVYMVVAVVSIPIYALYGEAQAWVKKLSSKWRWGLQLLLYTAMVGYIALVMLGPIPQMVLGEPALRVDGIRIFAFYISAASLVPGSIYCVRRYGGNSQR